MSQLWRLASILIVSPSAIVGCGGYEGDGRCISDIPCVTTEMCPGTVHCASTNDYGSCELDSSAFGREICDGVDNDCDGWTDGYFVGSELMSACECDRRPLTISSFVPSGEELEEECSTQGGFATLKVTADCSKGTFALCTSSPVDLRGFDVGEGGRSLLEISFDVELDGPLPAAVNLWYEGTDKVPEDSVSPRKYLPLLDVGDAPGSFVRRFAPESACFPSWVEHDYGCSGTKKAEDCGGCAEDSSCGAPTAGCSSLDFSKPRMQMAFEFCSASEGSPSVSITIHELALLSFGCLMERGI